MSAPLVDIAETAPRTRRPPWLIVAGAAIIAALWLLIALASEVREGEVIGFDRALMLAMRLPGQPGVPAGPAWLPSAMRDFTALGGGPVLTLVVLMAVTFLALKRQWRTAAIVAVATSTGGLAIAGLKEFFARARPDLIDHLGVTVSSASFPSGHAGNSAIVYLTLATLLFPVITEARQRIFVTLVALAATGLVGVSRVYLGVHWPTDVLAGWLFGALWAIGWWVIDSRLLPRASSAR